MKHSSRTQRNSRNSIHFIKAIQIVYVLCYYLSFPFMNFSSKKQSITLLLWCCLKSLQQKKKTKDEQANTLLLSQHSWKILISKSEKLNFDTCGGLALTNKFLSNNISSLLAKFIRIVSYYTWMNDDFHTSWIQFSFHSGRHDFARPNQSNGNNRHPSLGSNTERTFLQIHQPYTSATIGQIKRLI